MRARHGTQHPGRGAAPGPRPVGEGLQQRRSCLAARESDGGKSRLELLPQPVLVLGRQVGEDGFDRSRGLAQSDQPGGAEKPGKVFFPCFGVILLDRLDGGPCPQPDFKVRRVAVDLPEQGQNGNAEMDEVFLRLLADFEAGVSHFPDQGLDLVGIEVGPGTFFQFLKEAGAFHVAPASAARHRALAREQVARRRP